MKPSRSLILEQGLRATFHAILLFSVFLFFAGHNSPGGGFPAGLVAGAAFVLRFVTAGTDSVPRVAPDLVCGFGLTMAALTGIGSWAVTGELLESAQIAAHLPVMGEVRVSTVVFFDAGVYFIVVGLLLAILRYLGSEAEEAR